MSERKHFYVFDEKDVNKWRYCPICGEEILWTVVGEIGGRLTCSGEHPGEDVEFEVYSGEELADEAFN